MNKPTFSFLVHGDAGVGKSRLAATAPPPVLILDLEGRARYLPYEQVEWDIDADPPPEPGDWTHCVVESTKYRTLDRIQQWLASGQHPFRSFVVDSLSYAQKRFIADMAGTAQLKESDWGEVLRVMETMIRDVCDVPKIPGNPLETVVFVCGSRTDDSGRRVPLLQGALRDTSAYMVDSVGYLYLGTDGVGQTTRNLQIEPSSIAVAADKTDRLGGPVVYGPNLTEMHSRLSDERTAVA